MKKSASWQTKENVGTGKDKCVIYVLRQLLPKLAGRMRNWFQSSTGRKPNKSVKPSPNVDMKMKNMWRPRMFRFRSVTTLMKWKTNVAMSVYPYQEWVSNIEYRKVLTFLSERLWSKFSTRWDTSRNVLWWPSRGARRLRVRATAAPTVAPSVPPTSSSPKPCVRRLPGGPTRGPTIVNKLRCPSVTVTSGPVAPTTNSAATTIPLKYADRSLRDFLSEGKLLEKFVTNWIPNV